jgi:hypothetical protein
MEAVFLIGTRRIFRSFSGQIQPETRWKAAGKTPAISKQEMSAQKKAGYDRFR